MPSTKKLLEAAAGSAGGAGLDVADVFSTYLYTGTGNTQSIFNGIDLGPNTGGSISLQASPDGLEIPQSSAFNFGTGDLTCEAWIYLEGTSADYRTMFGFDLNGGLLFEVYQMKLDFGIRGGSNTLSTNAVPANQWNHVAIVRSSGTAYWFINGALDKTQANFTNTFSNATKALIGDYSQGGVNFDGSISNLRVSNVARYTSAFTPSTTPLTSDSNTVLLIGQNPDPFLDNSPSSHSVSTYASPAKSGVGPFNGTGGEGGLVWIKPRSSGSHALIDTARGGTKRLKSDTTGSESSYSGFITSFNSNGFALGDSSQTNYNNTPYTSWTFRKAPKFFDIVEYTGSGVNNQTFSHSLESLPGMVIIKNISRASTDWWVWITDSISGLEGRLNNSGDFGYNVIGTVTDTTVQTLNQNQTATNYNGDKYVAYLFASNSGGNGGFGPDGDQDIISCGTYTGNGNQLGPVVNLGWEPQFLMLKAVSASSNWFMFDTMRGIVTDEKDSIQYADAAVADEGNYQVVDLNATGFQLRLPGIPNDNNVKYVYIAIRNEMVTPPEAATEVFAPSLVTATQANQTISTGFAPDAIVNFVRSNANYGQQIISKLTGVNKQMFTNTNSTETTTNGTALVSLNNTGFSLGSDTAGTGWNRYTNYTSVKLSFKRAKGYMDVVAYKGNNTANQVIPHSLSVPPEMIWTKLRDTGANNWSCWHSGLGNKEFLILNSNAAKGSNNNGAGWLPTATTFNADYYMGGANYAAGQIAYLFATLDGISKLGSVSHSGSSTNVDCGFSNGSSFVMLKRTDAAGDWYAWDSARGIVSGNDPYLLFNSAAAEVTNTDYIDPLSSGFTITGDFTDGTYIFYAIA